jgi:hypothetical protein
MFDDGKVETVEAREFVQPATGELCMEVEMAFGSMFMPKREFWRRCERADLADRGLPVKPWDGRDT